MKILALFAFVLFVAMPAFAIENLQANNCEVFVDKISAYYGEHGSVSLKLYVKTLNYRLDGAITEVGFRNRMNVKRFFSGTNEEIGWTNVLLESFVGAKDYFELSLPNIASDYGSIEIEGAIYVKTDKGSYYWFKPGDTNFIINSKTFMMVAYKYNGKVNDSADLEHAVSTQNGNLPYFNPKNCY
jgi:hypothetical protein